MHEGSPSEVELKQTASGSKLGPQAPAFKPRLLLDVVSGEFSDDPAFARITLRTVDGSFFECFADGVTLKGLSDKFLAVAGHILLQVRGEPAELRPLHELDDDDEAEAPAHPLAQPMPMQPAETEPSPAPSVPAMPTAPEPSEATGWEPAERVGAVVDTMQGLADHMRASLSEEERAILDRRIQADEAERDARTRDFVESFGGKPASFFTDHARTLIRASLPHIKKTNEVIAITKLAGISAADFARAVVGV